MYFDEEHLGRYVFAQAVAAAPRRERQDLYLPATPLSTGPFGQVDSEKIDHYRRHCQLVNKHSIKFTLIIGR